MANNPQTKSNILIVDDEPSIVKVLQIGLESLGYQTLAADSGLAALQILDEQSVDLVLLDLRLGEGINGFQTMQKIRETRRELPIVMITAYGNIETAVKAIKAGACDFVCKPFMISEIANVIKTVLKSGAKTRGGTGRINEKAAATDSVRHFGSLLGESPQMQKVYRLIEKIAPTDATVLIEGESGTGKELIARAIHEQSRRKDCAWVPLNCVAIPESLLESELFGHVAGAFTGAAYNRQGLFLAANRGTIFLDEIGVMDIGLQSKLLRTLQEGKVRRVGEDRDLETDVRVIAATNESLEKLVEKGQFRKDLFYRISVIPIRLPPLRQRGGDIELLTEYFCRQQSRNLEREIKLSEQVLALFSSYPWPGNVRELQNAIACAATICRDGLITVDDLPPRLTSQANESSNAMDIRDCESAQIPLKTFLKNKEQQYIEMILQKSGGNRARAADMLGISRATFYRKYETEAQE